MDAIHPDVIITTQEALRAKMTEAYDRGVVQGKLEAANTIDPFITARLHRLIHALLLCNGAASGERLYWQGSDCIIPDPGGAELGARVDRVSTIVRQTLGNTSLAWQALDRFVKITNIDLDKLPPEYKL